MASAARGRSHARGSSAIRIGRQGNARLLPDLVHRLAPVSDKHWRLCGTGGCRPRRYRWCFALYGWRVHTQPCGSAKRWRRISPARECLAAGIQSRGAGHAPVAALYSGTDHPDVADCGLQPPPHIATAAVSTATFGSRSSEKRRGRNDAGDVRANFGCAS